MHAASIDPDIEAAVLRAVTLLPGERWQFTVRLRRPHGAFNPGGFDLEGWLFERNLRAGGYVREKPEPRPGTTSMIRCVSCQYSNCWRPM